MLLKYILTYDFWFDSLYIITVIFLGYYIFRFRSAIAVSMALIINSESNIVTVIPEGSTRFISETISVSYRYEFSLSENKIHEIIERFGEEITNNVITGVNENLIIDAYIMPIVQAVVYFPWVYEQLRLLAV